MPEFDVLPEIDSVEDRQRLADIARIYDAARKGKVPLTKPIAGVLAASGLSMSVSAQPDRDDAYPEVGLVNDRVDGWADGVDASDTYVGQLGQGTENHGTVSGSVTLDPNDGNTHRLETGGDTTINMGSVTAPKDGFSMSVLVESTDGESLTWDSSINWDGGSTPTNLGGGRALLVGLRTYDGGTSWVANYQDTWRAGATVLYDLGHGEGDWNASSSPDSGNSTSKNSDHLYMENGSDTDGDDIVLTNFTDGEMFDLDNFDRVYVEWEASGNSAAEANIDFVGEDPIFSKSPPFNRQYDSFDISNESGVVQVITSLRGENATVRVYRVAML